MANHTDHSNKLISGRPEMGPAQEAALRQQLAQQAMMRKMRRESIAVTLLAGGALPGYDGTPASADERAAAVTAAFEWAEAIVRESEVRP